MYDIAWKLVSPMYNILNHKNCMLYIITNFSRDILVYNVNSKRDDGIHKLYFPPATTPGPPRSTGLRDLNSPSGVERYSEKLVKRRGSYDGVWCNAGFPWFDVNKCQLLSTGNISCGGFFVYLHIAKKWIILCWLYFTTLNFKFSQIL